MFAVVKATYRDKYEPHFLGLFSDRERAVRIAAQWIIDSETYYGDDDFNEMVEKQKWDEIVLLNAMTESDHIIIYEIEMNRAYPDWNQWDWWDPNVDAEYPLIRKAKPPKQRKA